MRKSKIEWCDCTWNPVSGCKHGCEYCYARRIAERFGKRIPDFSGYPSTHDDCHCLETRIDGNPYPYLFEPTLYCYKLDMPTKKKWPQTVFVCSMADLFGDWVPDSWIEEVFEACKKAPQHRYMFLTKNPSRYAKLANAGKLPKRRECPNFWYGTTVTRAVDTAFTPGVTYNTFLSIEPLLGPLDAGIGSFGGATLIILGAETGNRKGKVTPQREWIDNICKAADLTHAAVLMKDSLIPIVGEENMRRELPWKKEHEQ